ncbi:probable WRKY transcription factor 4 [Phragmites australis]|uniref:probable WRKY transcription factor 4 n=1 Tax=Phragmites australis TaxID=29695 RepID=UPI002D794428|nr:probable WRKY transcription factor 4 [Phragmites australis]
MAAREVSASAAAGEGARRPQSRPTLSLPPRSAVESLFAGSSSSAAGAETSPGPLTLAATLFPDAASPAFHGSFTQLLVGAIGSPAAAGGPSPLSPFAVPPGLSPAALLGSPGLFSPTGSFEMSHQQALAQVTARAVHSPYNMVNQTDYSLPFSSMTTRALTSQHVNSSANVTSTQEIPTQPSHTANSNIESNEVSQGFQASALTVDKPADDGYNWRKYGQKAVKGGEYPRSYYKCTHVSCPVKKKVERSAEGHITQIIYRGQHNHQRPAKRRSKDGCDLLNEEDDFHQNEDASTRSEPGSEDHSGKCEASNGIAGPSMSKRGEGGEELSGSSDSEEEGDDEVKAGNGDASHANTNKRHVPTPAQRIIVQTTSEVDLLDDGFRWRKYGQKVVKGNPHPRSYYKCTYQGCDVKKHIERCSQDPKAVITTYEGKHNHDVPAARNSSHAAANVNASSSNSVPHRGHDSASSSRRADLQNASSASSMLLKEENEIT